MFDLIFIVNIFRWFFALWARLNMHKFKLYAKVRFISFWVQSFVIFFGVIGLTFQ